MGDDQAVPPPSDAIDMGFLSLPADVQQDAIAGMIATRYSGQPTQRDLDVANVAAAAERERIRAVVRDEAATWRDHSIKAPDAGVAAEYGYIAASIDALADLLDGQP